MLCFAQAAKKEALAMIKESEVTEEIPVALEEGVVDKDSITFQI